MKLLIINQETRLPEPTAEILTIPEFRTIWKRKNAIDGDRAGTNKTRNLQEYGYIYFHAVYDSRFKLFTEIDKEVGIRKLLKLPDDWKADEIVLEAIVIYRDLQVTGSLELVDSLEGTNADLSVWVKTKRLAIRSGNAAPKDVSEILDIIDRLPTTVESVKRAKETLYMEQERLSSGRKGRRLNKFEVPDEN